MDGIVPGSKEDCRADFEKVLFESVVGFVPSRVCNNCGIIDPVDFGDLVLGCSGWVFGVGTGVDWRWMGHSSEGKVVCG